MITTCFQLKKERRKPVVSTNELIACLCPCMLLGNISTKLHREDVFSCFKYANFCQDCSIGCNGLGHCISTCLMCLPIYPCSFCLSVYLLRQRWKLKLFYPHDDRLPPISTVAAGCYYFCYWPTNLSEQYQFVNDLYKENDLIFQWDYELYRDYVNPIKPPEESHIILSFGPETAYKAEFIRKLMIQTTLLSAPSTGSVPSTLDPHAEVFSSNPQYVKTGVRIVTRHPNSGKVTFLEYWDVPPNESNSGLVHAALKHAALSMYIFDCSHAISIPFVQQMFLQSSSTTTNNSSSKPRFIVILTKDRAADTVTAAAASSIAASDEFDAYQRSVVEMDILYWVKRQGVPWMKIVLTHEEEFRVLQKQIMKMLPKET